MTIELVVNFFDFGETQFEALVSEFRHRLFQEVASSDLPGLIFTFVWAVEHEFDREFVERSCHIFRDKGAGVYFVELQADLEERLSRNETEFRLSHKASKRDIESSRRRLLDDEEKYRLNSDGDSFIKDNYLKIDNTNLSATDTARMIADEFAFRPTTG
jgi:hypothetical protein